MPKEKLDDALEKVSRHLCMLCCTSNRGLQTQGQDIARIVEVSSEYEPYQD